MGNLCSHENFLSNPQVYTWSLQMEGLYLYFFLSLLNKLQIHSELSHCAMYLTWVLPYLSENVFKIRW
jgi:hypothetical protein